MRKWSLLISLLLSLSAEASINTATIIQDTLTALPSCLHYQLSAHFCIWISPTGKINTTPIVSHYLPDLVVSVFNQPHDNPWIEINKIIDNTSRPIQNTLIKATTRLNAGGGRHGLQNQHEQDVIFKEADVIGNPALLLIPAHGLLPSTATPWLPYYQSMTDSLLWRGIPPYVLPEEGMALGLNITHHVGMGFQNWGGMYPHEGKVINDNDVKASMVIAQRATDLLTNSNVFGHIHKELDLKCGKQCKAAPIQENSKQTYFQMIYPVIQHSCHVLGTNESYTPSMLNQKGAYVWIVWRHYEGCSNGYGHYIGRT